jgi:aspartyl/asparaginyl beta-hydroxylase (cupin superfamily)
MKYILLSILLFIFLYFIYKYKSTLKKNKFFYEPNEISNDLQKIDKYKYKIQNEVQNICNNNNWIDWPEKELYESNNKTWKILPFYGFGIWNNKAYKICPTLYNYLKSIKNLKLATLSKLSPKMKLNKHRGWASHSNYVIRCHYGLIIDPKPLSSYICVGDYINGKYIEKKKYHKQYSWLTFDDSKYHYAENNSDNDRIVLIIDIDRPNNIAIGKSEVGDSNELIEIINYFKNYNITNDI